MEILDEIPENSETVLEGLKKKQKVVIGIVNVLCFANGILAGMQSRHPSPGYFLGSILGCFFLSYLLGGLLGCLLALIPYKGLAFRQKYKMAALLGALVVAVLSSVVYVLEFFQ